MRLRLGIGPANSAFDHEAVRVGQGTEPEFRINTVCVLRGEEPVAGGVIRVIEGRLDEVSAEADAAVRSIDPNVAKVGESGAVGNDAEVGGLRAIFERAEDEGGIFGGALNAFEGNARCPIG